MRSSSSTKVLVSTVVLLSPRTRFMGQGLCFVISEYAVGSLFNGNHVKALFWQQQTLLQHLNAAGDGR